MGGVKFGRENFAIVIVDAIFAIRFTVFYGCNKYFFYHPCIYSIYYLILHSYDM
jgi:hypothetical protein